LRSIPLLCLSANNIQHIKVLLYLLLSVIFFREDHVITSLEAGTPIPSSDNTSRSDSHLKATSNKRSDMALSNDLLGKKIPKK
tara:strand:+ start:133 stop:381 length:249 start_codon:yes stop_codon:yes gene_type:complete